MPPAPITAPVMCLDSEPQGVLSSQPTVPSVSYVPLGAPQEVTGMMCVLSSWKPSFLGCRKAGSMEDDFIPHIGGRLWAVRDEVGGRYQVSLLQRKGMPLPSSAPVGAA